MICDEWNNRVKKTRGGEKMPIFLQQKQLRKELDEYYSSYDTGEDMLLQKIKQAMLEHKNESSYSRKSLIHEIICNEGKVKLFRNTPLFFEFSSGRKRHTWGGWDSHVGAYLRESTADVWLNPYATALAKDREEGFMHGWNNPVGLDHHCAGYDNLLALGLNGIIAKAEENLSLCTDLRQIEFYKSVIRSNRALVLLAQRFSQEAEQMAKKSSKPQEKEHYEKIARTAKHIPAYPPKTFYEARNLIVFYRECVGAVEGIGISTFGHLDRLLYSYYIDDVKHKRISRNEAKQLISDLLIYTEVRFETNRFLRETSTTIELGGCDQNGNIIYNELTQIILESVIETRSIGTKINCRISSAHSDEFLRNIAKVQLLGLPCIMMHNDDVLIPARVKCGQEIEDARLYLGCGCHEIVLANTEVCTRADTFINLPRILLSALHDNLQTATFEEVYSAFLSSAYSYCNRVAQLKNTYEKYWCKYDPLPLYSSSLTGSIDSGRDVTEGGVKYNTTSLSMFGIATLIDSLYAVKRLVFEERKITLADLIVVLDNNFTDNEDLRGYIINKLPKHGTNDAMLNEFSAKVLYDISNMAGQSNARGGQYLPAVYPHDVYRVLGYKTGATPDGRLKGTAISRGVSPSEFIEVRSPLDILHSLKYIDFTRFGESFITELTLPQMLYSKDSENILVGIIKAFLDAKGSSIQFNLIDKNQLIEAKRNPEQYKNIYVRVCGYSALFVNLSDRIKDEIISRAVR